MYVSLFIMNVSDFKSREDLENYIESTFGKTVAPKKEKIIGAHHDLARLGLSHGCVVWGVLVEATDVESPVAKTNVDRGERFLSKLL